jgi:hypothetical protein
LFIKTNIIHDIPGIPSASQQAASETIDDIWKQFQILSNMCNKVLHTTPKRQQGGGIQPSFIMEPDKTDVELVLISSLSNINYLIRRIEPAIARI